MRKPSPPKLLILDETLTCTVYLMCFYALVSIYRCTLCHVSSDHQSLEELYASWLSCVSTSQAPYTATATTTTETWVCTRAENILNQLVVVRLLHCSKPLANPIFYLLLMLTICIESGSCTLLHVVRIIGKQNNLTLFIPCHLFRAYWRSATWSRWVSVSKWLSGQWAIRTASGWWNGTGTHSRWWYRAKFWFHNARA